jgi:threonine/homoserine/homoserine lactone efflux protein
MLTATWRTFGGRWRRGYESLLVGVIGEILPLAVGIAISPIPIIAAILMLLSPRAKVTSVGFLLGWLAGIVIAIVLFTLLSSVLPQRDASGSSPVHGVIKIILGALLLFLAVKQWRGRPAEGEQAAMPKWMSAIDSMTAAKSLGLGFLLSAVNPKNLLLAISAGLIIGGANLSLGDTTVVIVVFALLAGCTVLVPVIGYLVASARVAGPLDSLRGWLVDNNATIMAVLLLVIGLTVIGKGIANF